MQSSENKELQLSKCPYNPSHTMPKERLLWHISNGCKDKQMYGHLYATCPHNPFHIMKKNLLEAHIAKCPDKKESMTEELGITEEELTAAIRNQFKPERNKVQKAEEQEKERIRQNNNKVLGYEEGLNQSTALKKKRIRKKKEKANEPKERPDEEKDWYQKAYGDHAQKLLNVEEKKDNEEDEFESMFKAEETATNRQQVRQNDNQKLQDNSMYNTQSDSLDVSSISFSHQ